MSPKIAVITPYYKESDEILLQCHESVLKQLGDFDVKHFMIADGHPNENARSWDCNHTTLKTSHSDNGNTPRAIGCLLAKNENYDFITFLDADNWYHENHISSLMQTFSEKKCRVITSFRTFHLPDGTFLDISEASEDALRHVDTSCILLHKSAFHINDLWSMMPKPLSPICDRVFMAGVRHKQLGFVSTEQRTVAFRTQYAYHYRQAGLNPPSEVKGEDILEPSFKYMRTVQGISDCIKTMGFWPPTYL